jgi:hypothetical protein
MPMAMFTCSRSEAVLVGWRGGLVISCHLLAHAVAKAARTVVERFLLTLSSTSLPSGHTRQAGHSTVGTGERIDLVTISMGASFRRQFGLQEEYDMTVEALSTYLSHLRPETSSSRVSGAPPL